jgi:LCP family protein required for cell wall assembly
MKPYRRFRAHGRGGAAPTEELEALRDLNVNARAPRPRSSDRPASPRPPRPPRTDRQPPPPRRHWWSLRGVGPGGVALRLGAIALALVLLWATLGFLALRGAAASANKRISAGARAALTDPGGGLLGTPQTFLIIGSDADRGRTGARADTVMLMRTNPDTGHIRYLSIPRDLRVEVPGEGHVKITEAYAYRGVRGVIRAIQREIGVPVNHVMVIDFKGVSKMVDAVGGVTVNNPYDLRQCPYPGGRLVTFHRGRINLSGPEALVYVRVRKCDSDLERARRQQLVVAALKSKVLSLSGLLTAPWRGARMIRAISTDLSAVDLVKFGWLQARLKTDPSDRDVLAGDATTIGGLFYFLFDPGKAGPQLRRFEGASR